MHLVAETFYTLHLRKWEGAQMCNELDNLLNLAGQDDLDAYPALSAFFSALQAAGGDTDSTPIVDELDAESEAEIPDHDQEE